MTPEQIMSSPTIHRWTNETMDLADVIQRDCHTLVEKLMADDPQVKYMDGTCVYIFNKLAELQIRLQRIENQNYKP